MIEIELDLKTGPETAIIFYKKRDFEIGLRKLTVHDSPEAIGRLRSGLALQQRIRIGLKIEILPLVKCCILEIP